MNSDIFREKCGENMQSLKKIIYKVPIIDKLIKKWEKCNNEITKLRSENKELKACIQKMSFEVRRNEVFEKLIIFISEKYRETWKQCAIQKGVS